MALAREMLDLAGIDADPEATMASGRAWPVWQAMIRAQGGDPGAALPVAAHRHEVRADRSGFVAGLDALAVGRASWMLGAGRRAPGDPVSATAGVIVRAGVGDAVTEGQPVLELHHDDPDRLTDALAELATGIRILHEPPADAHRPIVMDILRS
ncbi:MAG: hypothetical protein R2705_16765 [Ilumatobacteraceae bacterium]